MTENEVRETLLKFAERQPDILFAIQESAGSKKSEQRKNKTLPWCTCGSCQEMPTQVERQCCGEEPEDCLSTKQEMDRVVVDPMVLTISYRLRNEYLGTEGENVEHNKAMRFAAYRQFTLWRHQYLGARKRKVIPSCCVTRIRSLYPSQNGQYEGFKDIENEELLY